MFRPGPKRRGLSNAARASTVADMKEGPDITRIGAMIGDPARANILTALLAGRALTAGELAREAGVGAAAASEHLRKLEAVGLIARLKQGRHHYFRLAGDEVAHMLEAVAGLAAHHGHLRNRPGPRDPELRQARVCYDHLAGTAGVRIYDSLAGRGGFVLTAERIDLTDGGRARIAALGIDLALLEAKRRPLCRTCLDWSERRTHLAGSLGAALLDRIIALKWANRAPEGRAVLFSAAGEQAFQDALPLI